MAEHDAIGAPLDRYVVLEYLAEGGMGAIYLGKKLGAGGFEKEVVLKQLLPEFTQQPEFIDLFLREARLSASLDHANIVHTIDLVRAGEEYFIVMEYVRGGDLRTLLKRAKRRKRRIKPGAGIFIAREVLSALSYAHQKLGPDGLPLGLIHRDVSPSNILVSGEGEVKLTDFGIAKAATHHSVFYRVRGKVGYMSPEQARNEDLDPRSDLYSLAVCLYEMLTGERLFVIAGITTSAEEIYKQPVPAVSKKRPDLPKALDKVMWKALAVDREERFQTAGEFQEALLRVAHKNGLMMSASDLSRHMREVAGTVIEWSTTQVSEMPREGTAGLSGTAVLDDMDKSQFTGTQALGDDEAAQDLDDYLSDGGDGEWAEEMRRRPGLDDLPEEEARRRLETNPGRLTGLELTSIIAPDDLTNVGARSLLDDFDDDDDHRAPTPDSGKRVNSSPLPLPPARSRPPQSDLWPQQPESEPARRRTSSPLMPTERVTPVERRKLGAPPLWIFVVLFVVAGIGIAAAIGLTGPNLEPPALPRTGAAPGEPAEPGGQTTPELAIESEPPGATVFVEGRRRCDTPCQLTGLSTSSLALLRLEKDGYLPWSALLDFSRGAKRSVKARLRQEPEALDDWGRVVVRADAPADILLGDEPLGHVTTAGALLLPPGQTTLTMVATSGARAEVEVDVKAGESLEVEVDLSRPSEPPESDGGGPAPDKPPRGTP